MASVLGIGGAFFRCKDKKALTAWYEEALGMSVNEHGGIEFQTEDLPKGSYCVWGPFDAETRYFNPSQKEFMINLIVDDLDDALAQVSAMGAELIGDVESYSNGRFGWFIDPEGNKIELWQPAP